MFERTSGATRFAWWRNHFKHPVASFKDWRQRHDHRGPAEEPVGPSEYSGSDPDAAGLALLQLAALSRNWIHRRVDEVIVEERRTACRSVTLYLTLPDAAEMPELLMDDDAVLVPLALIAKRKLTLFTITDEKDRTLPALTRGQREHLCRRGLAGLARGVLPQHNIDPRVEALLDAIVDEPVEESRAAWRELSRAASRRDKAGSLANPVDDALGQLGQHTTFRTLALELATNVLLVAPVRDARTRLRVLRFSYIEPLTPIDDASIPGWGLWRPLAWVLRLIGWRAARPKFQARAIGDAASFHMEIEAPPGLQLVDPELVVITEDDEGSRREAVVDAARGSFRRAHLMSRPRPETRTAYARAKLRLRSESVLRGAFLNAVFATLALAVTGAYLEKLKPPAAAPALLLLAPSLMTLYVGQRLESPVSTRMAFGAKLLGTIPALCAFAAATTVVVASGDSWTGTVWWIFTGTSAVIAGVLAVSVRLARWRPERTDVR